MFFEERVSCGSWRHATTILLFTACCIFSVGGVFFVGPQMQTIYDEFSLGYKRRMKSIQHLRYLYDEIFGAFFIWLARSVYVRSTMLEYFFCVLYILSGSCICNLNCVSLLQVILLGSGLLDPILRRSLVVSVPSFALLVLLKPHYIGIFWCIWSICCAIGSWIFGYLVCRLFFILFSGGMLFYVWSVSAGNSNICGLWLVRSAAFEDFDFFSIHK